MSTVKVWTPDLINDRARRYLWAEKDARRLRKSVQVFRLGLMCCAAARFAYDIGPRFVHSEPKWGWPSVL